MLQAPPPPSFWQAVRFWFWLGWVSFGGPVGQIALLHEQLVERKHWISEQRFLHALNYCMLLPGPEAQQLTIYLGWLLHGTWGGVLAGSLFVLPSLLILGGLSWLYLAWGHLPVLAGALYWLKPTVVVIILHAAWRMGQRTLHHLCLGLIALAAFMALSGGLAFPWIILLAGLAGYSLHRYRPQLWRPKTTGTPNTASTALKPAAVLDDHSPTPIHAQYSGRRLVRLLAVGLGVWLGLLLLLTGIWGWDGVYARMARFFTHAAFLTFGGAYAVLPYVHQGAVLDNHWLSSGQMLDGLALGETTPGPLIMVVAFVGFLGGWQQVAGVSPALSGWVGACVATVCTFLPSFLFILGGGPLVEASRNQAQWNAPLSAITAAVIGVVVHLGVVLALQVLWPGQYFDGSALLIGLASAVAMWRYRWGIIPLIIGNGSLGALIGVLLG